MDAQLCALCIVIAVGIFTYRHWNKRRRKNYPNGPLGLPGVGSLITLDPTNPCYTFIKESKKYGPIFSYQLGWTEWIIVNNYELAKEALVKQGDKFSGRPDVKVFSQLAEGNGIGFIDFGLKWKSQRKFGLSTLTGFGLGKTSLEGQIHEEVVFLVDAIKKKNGKAFDCQELLTNAVSNIICGIVMGSRFSYDDKRFQNIIARLRTSFSGNTDARLLAIMTLVPNFRFLPFFRGAYKRQFEDLYAIFGTLGEIVEEHRKTYDESNIRDFIDAFLKEMKKGSDSNSESFFTDEQLLHYVRDLFIAGTDTTSNSIRWAIFSLVNYPRCQEKLQAEIDSVLGESEPCMKHLQHMPYTRAWIQELMRHRTVFPLLAPRKTTSDVVLGGYILPKDTPVMFNLWAIHQDPTHFDDPEKFLPERFLDENGNYLVDDHVIPFGMGSRNCMGAQLVKMELFIFLTSILQKFNIKTDLSCPLPNFDSGVFGFTYVPHQFNVSFAGR